MSLWKAIKRGARIGKGGWDGKRAAKAQARMFVRATAGRVKAKPKGKAEVGAEDYDHDEWARSVRERDARLAEHGIPATPEHLLKP